jgi:hypothetical protein
VALTSLLPDTSYSAQIQMLPCNVASTPGAVSDRNPTATGQFKTPPADPRKFSAIFYADQVSETALEGSGSAASYNRYAGNDPICDGCDRFVGLG